MESIAGRGPGTWMCFGWGMPGKYRAKNAEHVVPCFAFGPTKGPFRNYLDYFVGLLKQIQVCEKHDETSSRKKNLCKFWWGSEEWHDVYEKVA